MKPLKGLQKGAQGAACALMASAMVSAMPLLATPVQAETVRAVMHSGLRVLDPVATTAHITRDHGYMIFDTLLAMDEKFQPRPQMADWSVSDDGMVYTFTLRDGLKWHDGSDVTASDVVASFQRWAARDGGGQMLMDHVAGIEATDAQTVTLTLSSAFAYVLELMAKPSSIPLFIMPARIADKSPDEMLSVEDQIGSGPFRFVAGDYDPGNRVVYEKFEDYVPRDEPASWLAGGKVVNVDRVEWINMSDAQTALNALNTGEIDFLEAPSVDLLPILQANADIVVDNPNELGSQTMGRLNFLYPPFDNPDIRRAALMALNQTDVLASLVGNPEYYSTCPSMYGCSTPLATDAGAPALLTGKGDVAAAQQLLKDAGYDGTPVVMMQPTDSPTVSPQPVIAAQLMRRAGFTVDLQPMDWQTLVTRRASQQPPDQGGWNMFFTNWALPEVWNPLVNPMLNGRGRDGGWFGWPQDEALEEMREAFARAETDEARKDIAERLQVHAFEQVTYIPLGEYKTPSAWRSDLTGILHAPLPVFWNLSRSR
ncbi:ABC transporter substrate-binding protein [Kushneria marisflavi]|uniref:ABC transporter substrate-binding protein n=1 Tax=Kushneria marisflavi TaxID=157779 RepID=A0A240URD1_9GAMM|nr:ABC transporter substrate-binding protein [Kushneria marisflavi]ART64051.1 ABC transporter substrate-binding protein [Kushneria marisflavi]RKD85783.1 peptide/nickel transport system substrate-binding protein [Kushneria marisflavi]